METREKLTDFLMITVGTVICAAAVFFFLIPSSLTVGSISGLAIILSNLIPLSISVITFILNVGLLLLGFLLIGREFGTKTVYTSVAGMCVALSSAFLYDAKTVMLSVLGTYLNGIVLDHFIFGFDQKRRVCIMSSKLEELRQFILNDLHSGATIYESTGAYDNAPRKEIIVIVNKNEYSRLMSYVEKTDPKAFITVYAVSAVSYQPKPRDAK